MICGWKGYTKEKNLEAKLVTSELNSVAMVTI